MTDRILKTGSIILMIFAMVDSFFGEMEAATFLMAQAALAAAIVNWRD